METSKLSLTLAAVTAEAVVENVPMWTSTMLSAVTDCTPGTDRAATATDEGTVDVPPFSTKSEVSSLETPSVTLALTLEARTEIAATRARPIISALAVAAVRRGTRRAFWRASLPMTPTKGDERPGDDADHGTGGHRRGDEHAEGRDARHRRRQRPGDVGAGHADSEARAHPRGGGQPDDAAAAESLRRDRRIGTHRGDRRRAGGASSGQQAATMVTRVPTARLDDDGARR